jgi:CheY-like chemotaxis protein
MGLSLVRNVARLHQGRLEHETTPNGSCFRLLLPLAGARAESGRHLAARLGDSVVQELRVLVLEDDESVRGVATEMLDMLGARTHAVSNGKAAVAAVKEACAANENFDVALIDLVVPGDFGGEEARDQLQQEDPDLRFILISGHVNSHVLRDPEAHGFQAALEKPFGLNQLRDAVYQALAAQG